ncbi:MAG: hypothetical protein KIT10_04870 [Flavobacteriales bacterium]|nr:hypothetical protein [Flavobacteriales bacterium]
MDDPTPACRAREMRRSVELLGPLLFAYLLSAPVIAGAQDSLRTRHSSIALLTRFSQVKDVYNYGLAFAGGDLGVDYRTRFAQGNRQWTYEPRLVLGVLNDARAGIAAHFQLRPVDLCHAWRLGNDGPLMLGPYAAANYAWQLYPKLQSGHMFWYSSLELGVRLFARAKVRDRVLDCRFSSALLGWASRPSHTTEEYWYALRFRDWVRNPHTDLVFGGPTVFQHIGAEVALLPREEGRLALAYAFEYWGYSLFPGIKSLSHAIHLRWPVGGKRTGS